MMRRVPPGETHGRRVSFSGHAAFHSAWRILIGRPLRFGEAAKEQITPFEGLSALSLDALTSVAYGPEAILVVLATAGLAALRMMLPVTVAIVCLLAVLIFSYRQVIDAYPGGGGAYAVSRDNFPSSVSQVAAAALIVDYILTVAVSIAAGVASLTSAYPALRPATVPLCLGVLASITLLNLRGIGESARAFLLPTVFFIVGLYVIIAVGLVHPLAPHAVQHGRSLVPTHNVEALSVLLLLRAFAAGCSALTGVEAITNGVPLFRPPRTVRAKHTELALGLILGTLLLGLAVLALRFHTEPRSGQTVLSQIMAAAVGRNWAYYIESLTITVVLALAANTSFGGLPVLANLLARDSYLPHLFSLRGDRLVFSGGIWTLAIVAAVLLVGVRGDTNTLIPMYAIGVFTGFTLAQTGLVVHWRRVRTPGWRARAALNAVGAAASGVSTVIFLIAKFTSGAWGVVVAVLIIILLFRRIRARYESVAARLALGEVPPKPHPRRTLVIVPVTSISRLTAEAIAEALSLGDEVIAIAVEFDIGRSVHKGGNQPADELADEPTVAWEERAEDLRREWRRWHPGVPLHVLHTTYASLYQPIVRYVEEMRRKRTEQIVLLMPTLIFERPLQSLLSNRLDLILYRELRALPDVIVARVSMSLGDLEG